MQKPWTGEFPIERSPLDPAAAKLALINLRAGHDKAELCAACTQYHAPEKGCLSDR